MLITITDYINYIETTKTIIFKSIQNPIRFTMLINSC